MVIVFAKSQFFPTTKEYTLFNYHDGWNIENGTPISIPIKVINNPTVLIKSDEIHVITQVLDTQELSITGDTANHD